MNGETRAANEPRRSGRPRRTCHLHEGRALDPETNEWVYEVYCTNPRHALLICGWEMFRVPMVRRGRVLA